MSRKTVGKLILAVSIFSISVPAYGKAAGKLTIHGDPCSAPLATKLGEAFKAETGTEVIVSTGSCRSGVVKASDGEVNIGVSTFNFSSHTLPKGVESNVIAKAPIVMVVNKANPVNGLSKEQLEGILGGQITNWKEVGGTDSAIRNVMLPPCVTETMSYQAASPGPKVNRIIPQTKGNPVTGTNVLVSENVDAIGMQLYGYDTPDVKVLTIDGVLPTEETLPGKYGYYEDYNIITKGEPTGSVKEFIDFANSPKGRQIVVSMKHVPAKSN